MKFEQTITCRLVGAILVVALLMAAPSLLIADWVNEKYEFNGSIHVEVCQKTNSGWTVIDKLSVSNLNIPATATWPTGKTPRANFQLESDYSWEGSTQRGHEVKLKLLQAGRAKCDPAQNFLEIEFPLGLAIDGQSAETTIKLTTQSIAGPMRPLNGKLEIHGQTATATLVGTGGLKAERLAELLARHQQPGGSASGEQGYGAKRPDRNSPPEVVLVIRGEGQLTKLTTAK
jgi:hypothetical protein